MNNTILTPKFSGALGDIITCITIGFVPTQICWQ